MKSIILIIVLFSINSAYSQSDSKVYYEETPNGYSIFVNNNDFCPVSVELKFNLTNLVSTQGNKKVFIVPAETQNHKLTDLEVIKENKGYNFTFKSRTNLGNHLQNKYDKDFEYYLPFGENKSFSVFQGYNGSVTHQNENALDFDMPVGTEIYAARGGIIVEIIQNNNRHCAKKECEKYNNHLIIYHDDGSFAGYSHIKKNGAIVKEGDRVETGQLIAYSGNVGYSSGPHLHFVVFLQKLRKSKSLKTLFLVGDGEKAEMLKEKHEYKRSY